MNAHTFSSAERLVIAVDMNFNNLHDEDSMEDAARTKWKWACEHFGSLGVTLKGNTVIIYAGLEWCLQMAKSFGAKVFVDLKMFDVKRTILNTVSGMRHLADTISIVTVAERVRHAIYADIRAYLPNTVISPVNPLSDLVDRDFDVWGEGSREEAVKRFFARMASERMEHCNGVVCGAADLQWAHGGISERPQS